jgi:hypothetical protein
MRELSGREYEHYRARVHNKMPMEKWGCGMRTAGIESSAHRGNKLIKSRNLIENM